MYNLNVRSKFRESLEKNRREIERLLLGIPGTGTSMKFETNGVGDKNIP